MIGLPTITTTKRRRRRAGTVARRGSLLLAVGARVGPSRRATHARRALLATGALVATTAITSLGAGFASAAPATDATNDRPWVSGDHTVAYFDSADTVYEVVNVMTGMDGDQDGKEDSIRVNLARPDTSEAQKVPLIVAASPYFSKQDRNDWETNYFVPRGYAVATVALPGTDFSTGCDDVGANLEVLGTKAVIDWANGRAKGYFLDGKEATAAKWSTGKVGMIGVSWDGTIANSVASTGVEGLETIVPVAAISSWYDYTRGNGVPFYGEYVKFLHEYVSNFDSAYCRTLTPILQAASDDATGNDNDWWAERDYRPDASKITASVFVVHGLSDENVKTRQFGEWWDQLVANNVDRKLFLHQYDHIEPYMAFGDEYTGPLTEWFDYYLQDLDNGVPDGPQAIIQREDYESWTTEEVWPPADTGNVKMLFSEPLDRGAGALTTKPTTVAKKNIAKVTQSVAYSRDSIVLNPTWDLPDRAMFLSDQLSSQLHEAGTATVALRVKVNRPAAAFQVRVVDYNPTGSVYIVSRTEADLGHYASLSEQQVLEPGKFYTLTFEINTDDRIFAKDDMLGVVITPEQYNPTKRYRPVVAKIDLKRSSITMPIVGAAAASLAQATTLAPVTTTSISPKEPTRDVHEFIREFFEGSR